MSGPSLRTCPECGGRPEERSRHEPWCPENRAHDDAPLTPAERQQERLATIAERMRGAADRATARGDSWSEALYTKLAAQIEARLTRLRVEVTA
jgi:predicted  nucleic acid-binding Zn-ribbon protein